MTSVINTTTEKPDRDRKVFDEQITSKWRDEVSRSGQDVSEKMMDCIVKELRWKADKLTSTGLVRVFDAGVVKSDTAIPKHLQHDLKRAAAKFENIPEKEKDFHPGSDQKVVNLVYPSLFPLIFGRTRVLPDKVLSLDDCLRFAGEGEIFPDPSEKAQRMAR
ncbi:hypothetical protein N7492_009762 [Penicillium capsulatum]|uniref:Uncharacterized protein n=1 Tax=Penicillium capsulatum TaxID=69766 RepID=A0A9W9LFK4_9EURO|nr:hypothetical protein N7492_009762 [Penicillium capsulatum]